ncbi:MAG: hypothetical protein GY714_32550 [Desulfobacterales bacterium]|nr:hypothetical protein [Desulfobacterales bacterium]
MFTIKDLEKKTGLKASFIRRCNSCLKDVLEPHTSRGDSNRILYDNNALIIFDKIKQLKEKSIALSIIEKEIRGTIIPTNKAQQTKCKLLSNQSSSDDFREMFFSLQKKYEQLNEDRLHDERKQNYKHIELNGRLIELKKINDVLRNSIKLLPDGKTPEQIKVEWEADQKKKLRIKQIRDELEKSSGVLNVWLWNAIKRKELLKELDELLN